MEAPSNQSIFLQFCLLFVLTFLNAFFSAGEMAVVSLNLSRVRQRAAKGDKRYIRLLQVLKNPDNFLSTVQVGITLINIISGARFADSLGRRLASWIGGTPIAYAVSSFCALVILTYISIVFGELYPKRIAINLKDELAIYAAPVIIFLGKAVKPFVWLLSSSTNLLSYITPMNLDGTDTPMTRDEIEYMLSHSRETLGEDEIEMIQGIFSLDEIMARVVMVPRTDAFMVDINDDTKDVIDEILKKNYSRIPVYDGNKDTIVGIIHTKRLLYEGYREGFENVNLRTLLQEPLFVSEIIFIDDLLASLRSSQNQMAILLDEYGGVAGLVTLEDLLEEIIGEIADETDRSESEVRVIDENLYIVLGAMTLNAFNEYFGVEIQSDDVDTIAGYYITGIGAIPSQKETTSFEIVSNGKVLILTNDQVENGRITKIKLFVTNSSDLKDKID